ncbi:MAG: adenylate/guanylate cyclase domain-containing protein [Candidatus Gastranaerophilaceae bacterium]|jgi:adenylate cyclase
MFKIFKQLNFNLNFIVNGIVLFIAVVIAIISVYFYSTKYLEPKASDFLMRLTSTQKASDDIVNIIIDDDSLYEIGRWPWKRTLYADIFEFVEKYGAAKTIVFDSIIAAQGETNDDNQFYKRISKLQKLVTGIDFGKETSNNIFKNHQNINLDRFSLKIDDYRSKKFTNNSKYYNLPSILPEYAQSVNSVGTVAMYPDIDGVIRKIEPVINYFDKYYPSLALAAYININKPKSIEIFGNKMKINLKNTSVEVPLSSDFSSYSYIRWYKPYNKSSLASHKSYSAWKIIRSYEQIKNNKKPLINPDEFKNKIIVVGATAAALHDIKTTPMGANYPGIDIQSTFIDNLFNNNFVQKAPTPVNIIITVVFVCSVLLIINVLSPLYSAIAVLLLMFCYFYAVLNAYTHNYIVNIITPYSFTLLFLIGGYASRFFIETRKKEKIKHIMGKYVSKHVVNNIINSIDEVKPGGKKKEITVLFADIRGFTGISEALDPNEVTVLLNEYFTEMLPIIEKHKGVLNKFMGDALLAVFGEPVIDNNHPKNAVLCAINMIEKINELKEKWRKEGKPKIDIGIGINTGIAFIGNIGTDQRLEYTVIGDTVNVASRIEAQNRLFNTKLLISEYTYNKIKDMVDVIKISSVEIKGREQHIDIYEIINLIEQKHFKN